jgi:hypothetical protein
MGDQKSDYSNKGKYAFPRDDINPSKKQEPTYNRQWCEAAYAQHINDYGGAGNTRNRDVELLRLYAEGRQPMEKYLDILCPKDQFGKRQTFLDLSLDPLSVIPKFRQLVVGKFIKQDHEIQADAIDEKSGGERRKMRSKLWAQSIIEKELAPFKELMQSGVELQQAAKIIPKSIEELNMLESTGSFKLTWEIGMEKLLKDSFNISDWSTIKYRLYEDIFDVAKCVTRDYTDKMSGKAKTVYVDVARLVSRYSSKKKQDDIDYAGEILDLSPNDIRVMSGEQIPPEDIEKIIKMNNQSSNLEYSYSDDDDFYNRQGALKIRVLHLTWKSLDVMKQEKTKGKNGETYYNNVGYDFTKQREDQEVYSGTVQMVYSAYWVIGTQYVWDHGHENDIVRPTPKTVKLPYNIYKVSNKSVLELMIPSEDNFQLAWLKLQNEMAKAKPGGLAVDIGVLQNVNNGGNDLKPLEILQIVRETGDLIYKSTTHHNQVIQPNSTKPIFELPGTGEEDMRKWMNIMDYNIGKMRDLSGLNELMDSSAPPPNTLVGTAEIAAEGTSNILYPMYNAYKTVKETTAANLAYRIQSIIRYKDYKPYENVIGTALINIFKQGSPISASSYGILLRMKPSAADKKDMVDKARHAYDKGVIKFSDLMYLESEIENGSIKLARNVISYREEKYIEEQRATAQANTDAQSQAIKEQATLSSDLRIREGKEISRNKINEYAAKAGMDVEEYAAKHNYRIKEDDNQSKNNVKENLFKS